MILEEMVSMLVDPNVKGIQRREYFDRFYFKIGLILNGGNVQSTAEYLGYSRRAVDQKLQANRELKKLREQLSGVKYYETQNISKQSPYFGLGDIKGKAVTIDQLCNERIEETKRKTWFKREPVEEQINIIKRIKNLYKNGEPYLNE